MPRLPVAPDALESHERICAARRAILSGDLPPAVAAAMLQSVWTRTNRPSAHMGTSEWLALFDSLGGLAVGRHIIESARPHSPLTLYRAAPAGWALGMSWTPYRRTAHAYAWMRGDCTLWAAEVSPDRIRAIYPGSPWAGAWDEFVVDPRGLAATPLPHVPRVPPVPDLVTDTEDVRALREAIEHAMMTT